MKYWFKLHPTKSEFEKTINLSNLSIRQKREMYEAYESKVTHNHKAALIFLMMCGLIIFLILSIMVINVHAKEDIISNLLNQGEYGTTIAAEGMPLDSLPDDLDQYDLEPMLNYPDDYETIHVNTKEYHSFDVITDNGTIYHITSEE